MLAIRAKMVWKIQIEETRWGRYMKSIYGDLNTVNIDKNNYARWRNLHKEW
jgi:hypothetical protein